MIRYALACEKGHEFEGWFAGSDDFDNQLQRGFLSCPVCNSVQVSKLLMAPSVSTARKKDERQTLAMDTAKKEAIAKIREAVANIRANAEDVGDKFPEEARKIHYGEADERGIIGNASMQEAKALLDEGIDVAVRIGALPDSSLTAVPVGHVRRVVCAAPGFLSAHGEPADPESLHRFCTITAAMEGRGPQWRFLQDGQSLRLNMQSQLTVTSFQAAVAAAREGWGLTQVMSYQVAPHLASGALQVVLRDFEMPPVPVHLVYPEGRKSSAKVRSFVDFCVEALRRDLAALPA